MSYVLRDFYYRRLLENSENQCILVSGESGAGKTESTKHMISHLCKACSQRGHNARADLQDKIVKVNPLLEAFGNARTVMNHNSSRFGKFIELFYSQDGQIIGGKAIFALLVSLI